MKGSKKKAPPAVLLPFLDALAEMLAERLLKDMRAPKKRTKKRPKRHELA